MNIIKVKKNLQLDLTSLEKKEIIELYLEKTYHYLTYNNAFDNSDL